MLNPYKAPANQVFRETSLQHGQALQGLQVSLDSLTQGVSSMHLDMEMTVRQYHSDTTALHSALVNIKKNSEDTTSMLATSHKDTTSIKEDLAEMRTMLAALMSCDGRAMLPRLVSKPDALRKISDIERNGASDAPDFLARYPGEQYLRSRAYAEFQCTCNPHRVSKSRRRRIGPAFMEQKQVTDKIHGLRCPFACFNAQSHEKWSFGLSVKALRGVLHAALTISMSATFGAGGFGLAPSFAYFPVRENSPALEALDILRAAFYERVWSGEEAELLFRRCIKTLQATMMARKWSPFDIDHRGRSLLRIIAGSRSRSTWQGYQIKILVFLLNAGVPRDRPDNDGTQVFPTLSEIAFTNIRHSFPFHSYLEDACSHQDYAEAFDLLWPDELITIPLFTPWRHYVTAEYPDVERMAIRKAAATMSVKMGKRKFMIKSHDNCLGVQDVCLKTTVYESHLMQAIAQKSKPMLIEIIKKDLISSELSEMDESGCKMLHYLLGWPEGLRSLVEQCGNSALKLDDQSQILLIETALRWSGRSCISSKLEYCSHECACAEAVKLVLEAERSRPLQLTRHEYWVLAMLSASMKARDLVIEDLKCRRQELKDLGLLHLSSRQIARMDLQKPKVLDYYTGEVLQALKSLHIAVPSRLETEMKALERSGGSLFCIMGPPSRELGMAGPLSSRAASVFHILGASPNTGDTTGVRALADSLHSTGFRDIDVPDCAGVTPLTGKSFKGCFSQGFIQWNWGTSIESWLIEHGASLETQVPQHVAGYTATHHLFRWIGFQSGFTKESSPFELSHSFWESKGGFTQKTLDACRCKCSIGGCDPYNILWKMLLQRFHAGWRRVTSKYQWSRHYGPGENRRDGGHDDRQSLMNFILEETSLLEEAFELPWPVKIICLRACTFAMLPLRHTCCDEGDRTCDDEEVREIWEEDRTDIGTLEILMDEFAKKLGEMDCDLTEFYQAHWIDRMNEVLRQMDGQILTATEIEDMERLGVTLTAGSEAPESEKTETENEESLEYWIQRLDAVVE